MRKYLLTCFISLLVLASMAQKKPPVTPQQKPVAHPPVIQPLPQPERKRVTLKKSDYATMIKLNGEDVEKVYNGTFEQQFSTLRADSALFYVKTSVIDAFGHVVITQGDTLHVYSDKLHYEDATKTALLTDHVKMVDKDAVLTTNTFNYNTATKIGTYTDGGKLVSKDNVLTSKNGYYYAGSRDAYFRYNVVTTSPDALIKTDTMRYNSGSRITYFYGPTNIYGKKDKDTLYTENGTYNTKTEQAFFGKKNRYSQGTKSLKGDSLFYDKLKGYGKAIKNITFEDNEQHMLLKGDLGEYFKKEDKVVATVNPYVIFITEDKDTTKAGADTTKKIDIKLKDRADLKGLKTGTPDLKNANLTLPENTSKTLPSLKADSLAKIIAAAPTVKNTTPINMDKLKDSIKKVAPAVISAAQAMTKSPPPTAKPDKNTAAAKPASTNKPIAKDNKVTPVDTTKKASLIAINDTARRIKRDTMYIGADTLETQVVTYKYLKDLQEQRRLAGIRDTSIKLRKPFVPYTAKTMPKFLTAEMPAISRTGYDFVGRPLPHVEPMVPIVRREVVAKKPTIANIDKPAPKKLTAADSLKLKLKIKLPPKPEKPPLADTARVRILSAHHNVHIFKSDLQGKSDSLFYSSADSIIRSFVKPIYWAQGAQMSGDTIYLQMKNKKADHMDVFPNSLIVYIEKKDSTHFNQMGGKRLHAIFKDSKLSQATVTGNAETIYYNRKKEKVTEMQRSTSTYITANFKNNQASNMGFGVKAEHHIFPLNKLKDDDKLLKAFIWKPKERPASKEDVIHPKKPAPEAPPAKGGKAPAKTPAKPTADKTPAEVNSSKGPKLSTGKDSTIKAPAVLKMDSVKVKIDSLKKLPGLKKDSVTKKP